MEFKLMFNRHIDRRVLHNFLLKEGLGSIDDFYSLEQVINTLLWQCEAIFDLDIFSDSKPIYETVEDIFESNTSNWNIIGVRYYVASLPKEYLAILIEYIQIIIEKFQLKILFFGNKVSLKTLAFEINEVINSIEEEFFEVGSEELLAHIEMSYK